MSSVYETLFDSNNKYILWKFIRFKSINDIPLTVWVKAQIGQRISSKPSPFVKAPIVSRGIPIKTIERSLTSKLISTRFNFVLSAYNNHI